MYAVCTHNRTYIDAHEQLQFYQSLNGQKVIQLRFIDEFCILYVLALHVFEKGSTRLDLDTHNINDKKIILNIIL